MAGTANPDDPQRLVIPLVVPLDQRATGEVPARSIAAPLAPLGADEHAGADRLPDGRSRSLRLDAAGIDIGPEAIRVPPPPGPEVLAAPLRVPGSPGSPVLSGSRHPRSRRSRRRLLRRGHGRPFCRVMRVQCGVQCTQLWICEQVGGCSGGKYFGPINFALVERGLGLCDPERAAQHRHAKAQGLGAVEIPPLRARPDWPGTTAGWHRSISAR